MSEHRWTVGDVCLVMGWNDWPVCYGKVLDWGQEPDDPADKWYAIEALTPVIDWSQSAPTGYVHYPTRKIGETFNAHYSELRRCEPPPTMREIGHIPTDEEIGAKQRAYDAGGPG